MESKKPLILVTNDDGIHASGLRTLIDVMRKLGEVLVVAPDKPQSGMGHAVTIIAPLRILKLLMKLIIPSIHVPEPLLIA